MVCARVPFLALHRPPRFPLLKRASLPCVAADPHPYRTAPRRRKGSVPRTAPRGPPRLSSTAASPAMKARQKDPKNTTSSRLRRPIPGL